VEKEVNATLWKKMQKNLYGMYGDSVDEAIAARARAFRISVLLPSHGTVLRARDEGSHFGLMQLDVFGVLVGDCETIDEVKAAVDIIISKVRTEAAVSCIFVGSGV
jgi:hypothetical protein